MAARDYHVLPSERGAARDRERKPMKAEKQRVISVEILGGEYIISSLGLCFGFPSRV